MFCPVCHALAGPSLEMIGVRSKGSADTTANGPVDHRRLVFCEHCHAVFGSNLSTLDLALDAEAQGLVNQDFYAPAIAHAELAPRVDQLYAIIAAFERFLVRRQVFVEIGAGLGLLTRAAGRLFERAIGVDLEIDTAKRIGDSADNIAFHQHQHFVESILPHMTIDAVAAWHVLEHLPDPQAVLTPFLARLAPAGVFFGQIPLLREDYVIPAHHVFYRPETLIALCKPHSIEAIYMEKDESNDFFSFCFRKI